MCARDDVTPGLPFQNKSWNGTIFVDILPFVISCIELIYRGSREKDGGKGENGPSGGRSGPERTGTDIHGVESKSETERLIARQDEVGEESTEEGKEKTNTKIVGIQSPIWRLPIPDVSLSFSRNESPESESLLHP
jgi:hypothetical protein